MKKSIRVTKAGGPEVLKIYEEDSAAVGPQGVRVKVTAAGVNFADIMMRMGLYPEAPKTPFVPGYEIAGEIIEVGSEVKSLQLGDRVFGGVKFGGYTTEAVLDAAQVRKIPGKLTDVEAAAIPVNFLTAWIALHEMSRVRKGDQVLIQSAAGGVGIAAVQIAVQAGAHVVGLVSSKSKEAALKSLGVAEVLTYEEFATAQVARRFQVILDSHGGDSVKKNLKNLAPAGRMVSFGAAQLVTGKKRALGKILSFATQTPFFTSYRLMDENVGIFGLNVLPLFEDPVPGTPQLLYQIFDQIVAEFAAGRFKVIVSKTFPLAEAGEAHNFLQGRGTIGKVVLTHG